MTPGFARFLIRLCPYTHLWRVLRGMVAQRHLPESARPGACIALLGLFCPFFWIALLSGASKGEVMFHALHSGVVVCIGIALCLAGALRAHRDGVDCRSEGTAVGSPPKQPQETPDG